MQPIKKLEYKIVHPQAMDQVVEAARKSGKKNFGSQEFFNDLGAQGWEFQTVYGNFMVFMRELNEQPKTEAETH